MSPVPLMVGELYTREDLVVEYGGSVQSGGIVPSTTSDTVFIFTDPEEGAQFGYVYDGFSPDGTVLYYTGAGRDGDQVESGSNSPILTHAQKGRTLHAFVAAGTIPGRSAKQQRYLGEFMLDLDHPFVRMPSLDRRKKLRTVIVFRLLPLTHVDDSLVQRAGLSSMSDIVDAVEVPLEINSKYFFETSERAAGSAVRRESQLVDDFVASQSGHVFKRWAIKLPEERSLLLTDIYDTTDRMLYEAKAVSKRADLRMAVGQLFDYRRHVRIDDLRCSVLLPERPSADLRDFVQAAGVGLAFKDGNQFKFDQPESVSLR